MESSQPERKAPSPLPVEALPAVSVSGAPSLTEVVPDIEVYNTIATLCGR